MVACFNTCVTPPNKRLCTQVFAILNYKVVPSSETLIKLYYVVWHISYFCILDRYMQIILDIHLADRIEARHQREMHIFIYYFNNVFVCSCSIHDFFRVLRSTSLRCISPCSPFPTKSSLVMCVSPFTLYSFIFFYCVHWICLLCCNLH